MLKQGDLFGDGEFFKAEGMARVLDHADDAWKGSFYRAGVCRANTGNPFTAEDILKEVGLPPGHRNSVGAAMHALTMELRLKRVGFVSAQRTSRHAGMVSVWQKVNI